MTHERPSPTRQRSVVTQHTHPLLILIGLILHAVSVPPSPTSVIIDILHLMGKTRPRPAQAL